MKTFNLEQHPKITIGFEMPNDQYFDNLTNIVTQKIARMPHKVVPLYSKKWFWFKAVAAAIIVGLFVNSLNTVATNSTQKLDDYMVADSSITIDEISEHLTEKDIADLEQNLIVHDIDTKKIIETYL